MGHEASPLLPEKLPKVDTTIFTVMSVMAAKYDAINLGQGFPDYPMSAKLINRVKKALDAGHNQYLPMAGYFPLRNEIANKVADAYQATCDPHTEITITPGGSYAIFTAISVLVEPGDEVIIFDPAYDLYEPAITLHQGKTIRIQCAFPAYQIDWSQVKQAITANTKAIIINNPHNPTGQLLSTDDLEKFEAITNNTNISIISDEVYEHLVYDGKCHHSILERPHLYSRAFVCFSFGKTFNCTGWKVGYCIAPESYTAAFRKIHQFNAFCVNSPMQVALAEHLADGNDEYQQLSDLLQEKRDYLRNQLSQTPLKCLPSHSTYFELYSFQRVSTATEIALAERLVKECGVAVIPVSEFYKNPVDNKVLRFCFAKQTTTLSEAANRLKQFKW